MNAIRKLTAIILLGGIGLPAGLGVGLHLGQTDCCHENSVCGSDCPFPHASSEKATEGLDARVVAPHDCPICDFLALTKDARQANVPEVALDLLPIPTCDAVLTPLTSGARLSFHARGPPFVFPG